MLIIEIMAQLKVSQSEEMGSDTRVVVSGAEQDELVDVRKTSKALSFSAVKGEHYRILFKDADGQEQLLDGLIAVRQGGHLVINYAGGMELIVRDYFELCIREKVEHQNTLECSVTVASDSEEGHIIEGTKDGAAANVNNSAIVYAHGEEQELLALVNGSASDEALLANYFSANAGSSATDLTLSILLGGLGRALALSGSGGGGDNAGLETTIINGSIIAGPVITGHGLSVKAYKSNGSLIGEAAVADDGTFSINFFEIFSGPVLVVVTDTNDSNDYFDEASVQGKDLTMDLRAVTIIDGRGIYQVSVNVLTEIAVQKLGVVQGDNTLGTATEADIQLQNSNVAKAFGLSGTDLITGQAIAVIDQTGTVNTSQNDYGRALAAVSGMEFGQSSSIEAATADLVNGLEGDTLTDATKYEFIAGARASETDVGVVASSLNVNDAENISGIWDIIYTAADGSSNDQPVPTKEQYEIIGVTGIDTLSEIGLLGNIIVSLGSSINSEVIGKVNTVLELQAIASAVQSVMNAAAGEVAKPNKQELELMGITGVSEAHIAAIQKAIRNTIDDGSEINTLATLQIKINETIEIVNASQAVIEAYANNSANIAPTIDDFVNIGVTGVTSSNLAAINDALNSGPVIGTSVDTSVEIQGVVDAYAAIITSANGADDVANGAGPTAANYASIGVTDMDAGAETSLLGDVLDTKVFADIDTVPEVQALAGAVQAVVGVTGNTVSTAPTLAQLVLMGVTGVNAGNLVAVQMAIANTPANGTGVSTIGALQSVVNAVPPAVTSITMAETALKIGDTSLVTIVFSEAVAGFANADVTVQNGTLSTLTSSDNITWAATFTPAADITDTANVLTVANSYTDVTGNTGTAGTSGNYTINTTAPTISSTTFSWGNALNATDDNADGTVTVATAGVEDGQVVSVVINNVTYTGTVSSNSVSITVPAANLQALTDGSINYTVDLTNAAGNAATQGTGSFTVDTTPPAAPSSAPANYVDNVGTTTSTTSTENLTDDRMPGINLGTQPSDATTAILLVNGVEVASSLVGSVLTPTTSLGFKAHDISYQWVDSAGNASAASPTISITVVIPNIDLESIKNNTGGFSISGTAENIGFGASVSNVGDVNGDGLDDMFISQTDGPRYVVFGRTDNTADINLQSLSADGTGFEISQLTGINNDIVGEDHNNLSFKVSSAGDINGDGLNDLLMGTQNATSSSGVLKAGKAFVVYGKQGSGNIDLNVIDSNSSQGFSMEGVVITDHDKPLIWEGPNLGHSVSAAGDVNGDGFDDVIVSAVGGNYVVFGGTNNQSFNSSAMGTLKNDDKGFFITNDDGDNAKELNVTVSNAGDVNGDGFADLLVGGSDDSGNNEASWVVFGAADNNDTDLTNINTTGNAQGFKISTNTDNGFIGQDIASAGDVNGDGLADFIVSSKDVADHVKSFVVFGKADTNEINIQTDVIAGNKGFRIGTDPVDPYYQFSVSSAGDVNGDGLSDLIVSHRANTTSDDGPNTASGRQFVVFGKADGTNVDLDTVATGVGGFAIDNEKYQTALSIKGHSTKDLVTVSAGGDLNGDGFADLIVGASKADSKGTLKATGSTYVIFGGTQLGAIADFMGDASDNTLSGVTTTNASEFFVGGLGHDTIIGNGGADLMYGGAGNDIFVINASNITALQSAYNAGGNTDKLSRIDGGGGLDTLQLANASNLDLTQVANQGGGTVDKQSRLESIEIIDMATSTAANTLTLSVVDVNDLGQFNLFNAGNTVLVSGTDLATAVNQHQLLVKAGTADTVKLIGSDAYADSGTVVTYDSANYKVYTSTSKNSQVLIDDDATVVNDNVPVPTLNSTALSNTNDRTPSIDLGTLPSNVTSAILLVDGNVVASSLVGSLLTPTNDLDIGAHALSYQWVYAGNSNSDPSIVLNIVVETPTVSITMANVNLMPNETSSVNFQFSENVTGFASEDVTTPNGSLSNFTKVNDSNWTATLTPTASVGDNTNIISIAAGSYTDANGNSGAVGNSANYIVDTNLSVFSNGLHVHGQGNEQVTIGLYDYQNITGEILKMYRGNVEIYSGNIDGASDSHQELLLNLVAGEILRGTITYLGVTTPTNIEIHWVGAGSTGWNPYTAHYQPIVLDLNRDGDIGYTTQVMDINTDGQLDVSAWASSEDGVLVWDKFGDSLVTDISQYAFSMYGGNTDLEGLAVGFDSNSDGMFDAQDDKFSEFGVWQDVNANGVSEAGELLGLVDLGVKSINLTSDGVVRNPANGVTEAGRTTVEMQDGSTLIASDAVFSSSALDYELSNNNFKLKGADIALDFSTVINSHAAENISSVDITGTGNNTLSLNLSDVLALPNMANNENHILVVNGDELDTLNLTGLSDSSATPFEATGASLQATYGDSYNFMLGHSYDQYSQAGATLLVDQSMLIIQ